MLYVSTGCELDPVVPEGFREQRPLVLDVGYHEEARRLELRADVGEETARRVFVALPGRVLVVGQRRIAARVHVGVVDQDSVPAVRREVGGNVRRPLVLIT